VAHWGLFIFYEVGEGLVGFGGANAKKMAFEGKDITKIREKGGHMKYFSKSLKCH